MADVGAAAQEVRRARVAQHVRMYTSEPGRARGAIEALPQRHVAQAPAAPRRQEKRRLAAPLRVDRPADAYGPQAL